MSKGKILTPGDCKQEFDEVRGKDLRSDQVDPDFLKTLSGYSLVTAEILYRMPDQKNLLQTYLWQEYDQVPKLPVLMAFLDFWNKNLDGPIKSVQYAHKGLISPQEIQPVAFEGKLH